MKLSLNIKYFILSITLFFITLHGPVFSKEKIEFSDPHPQAYFCSSLPVNQDKKFHQYKQQMKTARKQNEQCRKRHRTAWKREYKSQLKRLDQKGLYKRDHFHKDDWRKKRFSSQGIRNAKQYAEHLADKKYCPFHIRPIEDPISDKIDTITSLNNFFKNKNESRNFADNLGNEIFNWVVLRSSDEAKELTLDKNGKLIGDEFRGDISTWGSIGLFFSDGKKKPERVLHYLAKYVEEGPLDDREFKLTKVKILLNIFKDIMADPSSEISGLKEQKQSDPKKVQKYRQLTQEVFRSLLGQSDENKAVAKLATSTHSIASEAIKDFLTIKLIDLKIKRPKDKKDILGAVSYVLGETNENTDPPIENREFEFFDRSTLFGSHLKGNIKDCLDCALNMSAMVQCYQRGYAALQDPLVSWTLKKFEFNTSNSTKEGKIAFEGKSNVTQIQTSLGDVGERFEEYLHTGDFFGSFLKPSSNSDELGPPKPQGATINLLNDTKIVFESSYSDPPKSKWETRHDIETYNKVKGDPLAINWMAFQDGWAERYQARVAILTDELIKEYKQFSESDTPAVSFHEALLLKIDSDSYLDKLKLHYAMESTLRFMTKTAIDTLLQQLNLTDEKIKRMKEPLKSKAIKTRNVIFDKKLNIFTHTIPKLVSERLDDLLNNPETKDLPLFEYAIENLREKSVQDGFDIINGLMNDDNIQEVVRSISDYKYTEISLKFGIDDNDEIGKGLKQIIVGTKVKPSLTNAIFEEVQTFFKDVQSTAKKQEVSITDKEMSIIFDDKLLVLNEKLLNYTFTGENKKLFKNLVYNLYQKYMDKIIALDPNAANNIELQEIKRKIDEFVLQKSDEIINKLKLRSHGRSPIKVIEDIEKNLVQVLNQDVFGNNNVKHLLKSLAHELLAVQIQDYSEFVLNKDDAAKIQSLIKTRAKGVSKMDAAFQGLVSVFYRNWGTKDANIAEVLLNLKTDIDSTVDSFFEDGNQKTIEELVVNLQDKITKDLGNFVINNETLIQETIANQQNVLFEGGKKLTNASDQPLRKELYLFNEYISEQLTSSDAVSDLSSRVQDYIAGNELKIMGLVDIGKKHANEKIWKKPESKERIEKLIKEIINAEKRRIFKLLGSTYDRFDRQKKQSMGKRFQKLFLAQEKEIKSLVNLIFKKAKTGDYPGAYTETLEKAISTMNEQILGDSEFRDLLEELLKDSVRNSIEKVSTSTLLPKSTKTVLRRIGKTLTKDVNTIFEKQVNKEFATISDVINFVDDIAHYSINEVIVNESKKEDIGMIFSSTIYTEKGLKQFTALKGIKPRTLSVPEWDNTDFTIPHPSRFDSSANIVINSLRLRPMPLSLEELANETYEKERPENLKQYLLRLQDNNYSLISPLLGEIAEVLRFQSFCPQFNPVELSCIKDPSSEKSKEIYNKKFLQTISFIRNAAASKQQGCRENVSKLLSRENLEKQAMIASSISKTQDRPWSISVWLSEIIKSNKGTIPSVVECALTHSMSKLSKVITKQNENIEKFAGTEVQQALSGLLTPEMLITLRKSNPGIYANTYERIAQFFLNPNEDSDGPANINEVITQHVNQEVIPQVIKTPEFQKRSLLLLANTDTNKLIESQGPNWNIILTPAAWFTSLDRDWITTLQGDLSADITEADLNDMYKFMPSCISNIAQQSLSPIKLNAQGLIKQLLDPTSGIDPAKKIQDNSETFCFTKPDGTYYCIPVMAENLEQLDDAQRLELLIRRTTKLLKVVNENYTEKQYKLAKEDGQVIVKCHRVLNMVGFMDFGDNFMSNEKELIDDYMVTLKAYMQDLLRLKLMMKSIKTVLPLLKEGKRNEAAKKLMSIYKDKSRKAKWISSPYGGAWGAPGHLRPQGVFRKMLDQNNLKLLESDFKELSDCLSGK